MRPALNANRRHNERGFTLVEVLAALLIFSLSIIGLTHAGTQSAQAVSVISEKSLAGIVADNTLVKARLKPLKIGIEKGEDTQMGQRFFYVVTTTKTPAKDFYSLDVAINKEGSEQIILTRKAFRSAK